MRGGKIKFLNAIKNASLLKKEYIYCYYKKTFLKTLKVLYKEGLIKDFSVVKIKTQIKVVFKHTYNLNLLNNLQIISKPSYTLFFKYKDICQVSEKYRVLIFLTAFGLLNSIDCKKKKIGGKLLFLC